MLEMIDELDKKKDDLVNGNAWHIYNPMTEHTMYKKTEIYTLVHEHNGNISIVVSFDTIEVEEDNTAIDLTNDYFVLKLKDRVVATVNMSGIPNYIYEWLKENVGRLNK